MAVEIKQGMTLEQADRLAEFLRSLDVGMPETTMTVTGLPEGPRHSVRFAVGDDTLEVKEWPIGALCELVGMTFNFGHRETWSRILKAHNNDPGAALTELFDIALQVCKLVGR